VSTPGGLSWQGGWDEPGVLSVVIVESGLPGTGVFVYSGVPAAGNPPIGWISAATTDPFGNTLTPAIAGVTPVIGAGQDGSVQVLLSTQSNAGLIQFPVPVALGRVPFMGAGVGGSGAILEIQGPAESAAGQTDFYLFTLLSFSVNGTGAQWFATYTDANGGVNTHIIGSYAGLALEVVNTLNAVQPGTGTSATNPAVPETWHAITLDGGWSAGAIVPSYRLLPDGNLQLKGNANRSGIAGAADVNNGHPLPAAYRPPGTVDFYSYEPEFNRAHMSINSSGVITASSSGTVTGTWFAQMNTTMTLT
jgi:hypothetical protein